MIGLLKKPLSICQSGWKEISNATSGNLFNPLGSHNKHLDTSSQALLTGVKLRLRCRLPLEQKKEAVVERWPLKRGLNTIQCMDCPQRRPIMGVWLFFVDCICLPIMIPKCFVRKCQAGYHVHIIRGVIHHSPTLSDRLWSDYDPQMFHMKVSGRVSCSY